MIQKYFWLNIRNIRHDMESLVITETRSKWHLVPDNSCVLESSNEASLYCRFLGTFQHKMPIWNCHQFSDVETIWNFAISKRFGNRIRCYGRTIYRGLRCFGNKSLISKALRSPLTMPASVFCSTLIGPVYHILFTVKQYNGIAQLCRSASIGTIIGQLLHDMTF